MTSQSSPSDLLHELNWRGLIFQRTHEQELETALTKPTTLYCGFDPSANSMQVGNLLMIVALARFRRAGHLPIAVAGGATGLIGDPSGKTSERNLLNEEEIQKNTRAIGNQLRTILDRAMTIRRNSADPGDEIPILNNADWMQPWSFIGFLRDVGKHFRVNTMMTRESVRARLEDRDQGISYTEFSYQLIQSYDFLHLRRTHDCTLQIGGSDQWGNIISGVDLIRRVDGSEAFGLTLPLVTDAEGKKFGKSEAGAVYLSPERTSPYTFYQFWINQPDGIVIDLLKKYTFLTESQVAEHAANLDAGNNRGEIQQVLAYELTWLVHGREEADAVVRASKMLFGEKIEGLTEAQLDEIFADVPSVSVQRSRLEEGITATDLFAEAFNDSKSSMRRLLKQGGCYINNVRLEDEDATITVDSLVTPTKMVLRSGRKRYCVLKTEA